METLDLPLSYDGDLVDSVFASLDAWIPADPRQQERREAFLDLIEEAGAAAFDRARPEHLTVSCFILSPDHTRVLLCFHRAGRFWVQLGGHFDPADRSLAAATLREGQEESGLRSLSLLRPHPLDLVTYRVGPGAESCRMHRDIAMVAIADPDAELIVSRESSALHWWPISGLSNQAVPGLDRRLSRILNAT
jgi:hypothetical protein